MIKYAFVSNGLVVGICMLYDLSGNSSCYGPPGSTSIVVPSDSPVTDGWRYIMDEDTGKMAFFPPM